MSINGAPPDGKGLIALSLQPGFAALPGAGGRVLPGDEVQLVSAINALEAVVGPLVPGAASGSSAVPAAVTIPLTLNDLWVNLTLNGPGRDTNDGFTSATPLATVARAIQILGNKPVFGANFTLHIVGTALPTLTENLILDWVQTSPTGICEIAFAETANGAAVVLTGVTNRVPAANTRQAMTDGATNWTTAVQKIVRNDSNTVRNGSKSIILSNNGGGAATVATWLLTTEATIAPAPVETRPIVGDSVQVVDMFPVTGNISIVVRGVTGSKFFLRSAQLNCANGCSIYNVDGVMKAYLVDCVQTCNLETKDVQHVNVSYTDPARVALSPNAAQTILYGGGLAATVAGLTIRRGANVTIDLGLALLGKGLVVTDSGTMVTVLDLGLFSVTAGNALNINDGAYVKFANAAAMWGVNAGAANIMAVAGGSTAEIPVASTWTLTIPATAIAEFLDGTGALGFPFNVGTRVYDAAITINKANLDSTFPNLRYISPINGNRFMTG